MKENPLKEMIKGQEPLHCRGIDIKTYPAEGSRVIVEGRLDDERQVPVYRSWAPEPRPAGPVHGLVVRFLVGDYPLTIIDAEAEMPTVPHELCDKAKESVKKLINMPITSGYSERVRDIIGGINGCAHLTHLAVVMGPAAVHGFWTLFAQNPFPKPKTEKDLVGLDYIINTCHLWTPDGPFIRELKEMLEEE